MATPGKVPDEAQGPVPASVQRLNQLFRVCVCVSVCVCVCVCV